MRFSTAIEVGQFAQRIILWQTRVLFDFAQKDSEFTVSFLAQ